MRSLLLAIAVSFFVVPACLGDTRLLGVDDINGPPVAPADVRYAYGTDPVQCGDLRLPKDAGTHPVAVVIHGGCWIERYADLQNSTALAEALRQEGFAPWNIEYRRIDQPGGGWPGTFLDVAHAVDPLRDLAKRYPLDLNQVIVIGHSAGGQLALWAAARHRLPKGSPLFLPNPLPLNGVVALGTPADLAEFRLKEREVCGEALVTDLLGGSPEQVPERYAQPASCRSRVKIVQDAETDRAEEPRGLPNGKSSG